ncbi:hypothetical protein [Chryseobacterium sp.]|uniref:hypothetical protein n=1 Tax=Chryseobacterium sp. TaxID=1871047 RepID=UPI0025C1B505|nr:hypothetical protein [Chryseobacterium sp.]
MKKILVISSAIIVLVLFNYPVFDSEKMSYAIIFLCFVAICFAGAKIYAPGDEEDYESVEKEMSRLYTEDGIFQYREDGFYVLKENSKEYIKWNEIVSVYYFSIPVLSSRQTGLEIITEKSSYEFNTQDTK